MLLVRRSPWGGLQEWVWVTFLLQRAPLTASLWELEGPGRCRTVVFGSLFPATGQEDLFSSFLWLSEVSLLHKSFSHADPMFQTQHSVAPVLGKSVRAGTGPVLAENQLCWEVSGLP